VCDDIGRLGATGVLDRRGQFDPPGEVDLAAIGIDERAADRVACRNEDQT